MTRRPPRVATVRRLRAIAAEPLPDVPAPRGELDDLGPLADGCPCLDKLLAEPCNLCGRAADASVMRLIASIERFTEAQDGGVIEQGATYKASVKEPTWSEATPEEFFAARDAHRKAGMH